MKIQLLSIDVGTKQSKAGKSFQNVEVAFKNFDSGKVESKNITQYSKVFKAVCEAPQGTTAEVETEKNDAGFWEWTSFKRIQMTEQEKTPVGEPSKPAVAVAKSTYETPEERAKKQVYIIKQSSLANAIQYLPEGSSVADVVSIAQVFTDWVLNNELPEAEVALADLLDDIPF